MKQERDIVIRAILLLCLSDRCALERPVADGIRRSLSERECQRNHIINWLKHFDYYDKFTDIEKEIMEKSVKPNMNLLILSNQMFYESLVALLWSLGLIEGRMQYTQFTVDDLHPYLDINPSHNCNRVLSKTKRKSSEQIKSEEMVALLWQWRATKRIKSDSKGCIEEEVFNMFGEEYRDLLLMIDGYDQEIGDFTVDGKSFLNASDKVVIRIANISMHKRVALDWTCGENSWEESIKKVFN